MSREMGWKKNGSTASVRRMLMCKSGDWVFSSQVAEEPNDDHPIEGALMIWLTGEGKGRGELRLFFISRFTGEHRPQHLTRKYDSSATRFHCNERAKEHVSLVIWLTEYLVNGVTWSRLRHRVGRCSGRARSAWPDLWVRCWCEWRRSIQRTLWCRVLFQKYRSIRECGRRGPEWRIPWSSS